MKEFSVITGFRCDVVAAVVPPSGGLFKCPLSLGTCVLLLKEILSRGSTVKTELLS